MADSEQNDLSQRVARGDGQALAELFARHRERLWRMIHFRLDPRLAGRVDPDDVLQEGFLAASRRLGDDRLDEFFSPFLWLRNVVSQTLVDAHRQHLGAKKRDAGREVGIHGPAFPQATSTSLANQLAGDFTSPSQAAARGELRSLLERTIDEMNPVDREILALRHFEELTNNEVAATLGIQPKAASIRYIRALKRLREILAEVPGFPAGGHDE